MILSRIPQLDSNHFADLVEVLARYTFGRWMLCHYEQACPLVPYV